MKQTVAIIGCGSIGSRHARLLRQTPELQALCDCVVLQDQDEMAARHLAADVGACWVTIPEQAVQIADAVLICTWPDSHLALARLSIEAGKPTFIEKPLALTMTGVEELVALAEARQVKTMVACNWRFHPNVQKLRDGTFAKWGLSDVQLWVSRAGGHSGSEDLDLGTHAYDLACYLGAPDATLDIGYADHELRALRYLDGSAVVLPPTDVMYVAELAHFLTRQTPMNGLAEAADTLRHLLARAA